METHKKIISMIPARMGSQRLARKNLRELDGVPLITRAIRSCKAAGIFDEIWVNSEDEAFAPIAETERVHFHKRPEMLGNDQATSEQYIEEFLQAYTCEYLVQVHSIAPLLTPKEISGFSKAFMSSDNDVLLSCTHEQIECAYRDQPVNFTLDTKTNSQELKPIQRVTWSITGWRRETFLGAVAMGSCATYAGKIGYYPVSRMAGHIIKTEEDLQIAEALLPLIASKLAS